MEGRCERGTAQEQDQHVAEPPTTIGQATGGAEHRPQAPYSRNSTVGRFCLRKCAQEHGLISAMINLAVLNLAVRDPSFTEALPPRPIPTGFVQNLYVEDNCNPVEEY